jgi:alpha-ribazole phosphatase
MTLWVVRHARPLIGNGVCYGATDVRADDAATREAALALARALPERAILHTSTLQRCEQLTQILSGLRPDLIYKSEPRLVEMHFGNWEGVAWDAIAKNALDAWTQDFAGHRFGGQESVSEFMARIAAVWDECRTAQSQSATQSVSTTQVWITHAGVARAATLFAQGIRLPVNAGQWPVAAPDFGAWITLPMV